MTRLLMLNWRDWSHPRAGGAEVVTYEVLKRLVTEYGYQATLLTATYPGAAEHETIDGIQITRRGSQRSVHWQGYRFYREHPGEFDIVVDQVNTIPFLTPLYVREPHTLFIHQLAREVWWHEAPLIAPIGYPLESLMLRAYHTTPVVTVSESTKQDLVAIGHPAETITVVPQGLTIDPIERLTEKPTDTGPQIVFLARLVSSKRPDHAIRAFARIRAAFPTATLTVMGRAKYRWYERRLQRLVDELKLTKAVTFTGYVDEAMKRTAVQDATLLLVTSAREGWGLIVTEAAALGTPSAVYDIAGLRDAVGRGEFGVVAEPDPMRLGNAAIRLLKNHPRYEQLRRAAWQDAKALNWDRTARAFYEHLERTTASFATPKLHAPNSK